MSLAAALIYAAAFVFSLEMWSRKHPPESPPGPAAADGAEWVDRFEIRDSGIFVPAVGAFLEFVAASGSQGGLIHNYVNHGMRRLSKAVMEVSNLNLRVGEVDRMHGALGRYLDSLERHPRWNLEPARVRPAMLMAVEIMGSLNLPYDEATRAAIRKAKDAALALEEHRSTLWQRAAIQDFFIASGNALVLIKQKAAYGHAWNGASLVPWGGGAPSKHDQAALLRCRYPAFKTIFPCDFIP